MKNFLIDLTPRVKSMFMFRKNQKARKKKHLKIATENAYNIKYHSNSLQYALCVSSHTLPGFEPSGSRRIPYLYLQNEFHCRFWDVTIMELTRILLDILNGKYCRNK